MVVKSFFKAIFRNGTYYLNPKIPSLKNKNVTIESFINNKENNMEL